MKKILLPLLLTFAIVAQGQKMTLQECVKIALDNNLTVKRSVYNVESSEINLLSAKGNFLPTLNLSGTVGRNYGRGLNPVTNQYISKVTGSFSPSLNGQLTIFNGFRLQNTYRQNRKSTDAANLDLEKTKNDVIITVVTNFANVVLNKELFENAKFQLNSSQQQLDRIKKQVAAGALPRSNELTQEATVATNETNLITQENTYNLSLLQLKQSMQVPASTQYDIIIPDIAMEDLTITQTPEEIYEVSTKSLPQVKSAMLKVEAAQFAMKSARAAYYPRLTFGYTVASNYNTASDNHAVLDGTTRKSYTGKVQNTGDSVFYTQPGFQVYDGGYGVSQQIGDNLYKQIGVTLSIPILNGFQTRSNVQQAVINQELANITVKETENALRQSIETAYNNALAAAKTYTAALKQVSANEEAFRMTEQRHQNGAATYIEYQVASNDLFSAKSALARAKYNFIFTKKVLEFYQGKTFEY